eukprot:2494256-Pyramimonas_sp.AAC.2
MGSVTKSRRSNYAHSMYSFVDLTWNQSWGNSILHSIPSSSPSGVRGACPEGVTGPGTWGETTAESRHRRTD